MTTVTLSKRGHSSAIRLPSQFVKRLNLEEGSEVQIILTPENDLLLRPVKKTKEADEDLRAHLQMLLSKIKPGTSHDEVDLGIEGDELL